MQDASYRQLLSCAAVETLLNKVIAQNKSNQTYLSKMQGAVICIKPSQLSWPLYLIISKQIQVVSSYCGDADVTVTADITDLYRMQEGAKLTALIKEERLTIAGDINVLQNFINYIQQLNIDIAEPLSKYIGDAPTHLIMTGASCAKQSIKYLWANTQQHLSELTTEEYQIAPSKLEFIHHTDNITELSQSVEDVALRIVQLTNKVNS